MNKDVFTGKAEVYVKSRPSYPDDVIQYITSLSPLCAYFADIGAGTGKLTELIAKLEYPVYAIEPNNDMRSQLIKTLQQYSNATVIDACAEVTKLPKAFCKKLAVSTSPHIISFINCSHRWQTALLS
ncbi:hypothetical protein FACS1894120_5550 [Clostridia bacterium]|nr:hypothetical protein FACS1894120_5550 [Clostridia bacterium]